MVMPDQPPSCKLSIRARISSIPERLCSDNGCWWSFSEVRQHGDRRSPPAIERSSRTSLLARRSSFRTECCSRVAPVASIPSKSP